MEYMCFVHKAKEAGKMSRLFGKWNRRFLTLKLETMEFYYAPKASSNELLRKNIPLEVSLQFNSYRKFIESKLIKAIPRVEESLSCMLGKDLYF